MAIRKAVFAKNKVRRNRTRALSDLRKGLQRTMPRNKVKRQGF